MPSPDANELRSRTDAKLIMKERVPQRRNSRGEGGMEEERRTTRSLVYLQVNHPVLVFRELLPYHLWPMTQKKYCKSLYCLYTVVSKSQQVNEFNSFIVGVLSTVVVNDKDTV